MNIADQEVKKKCEYIKSRQKIEEDRENSIRTQAEEIQRLN